MIIWVAAYRYIDRWFEYFDPEQLFVVDGEKLVSDPHLVMGELQNFLGLRQFITKG